MKKKKKHLSEKSFSVFIGPPPNNIEHTKKILPNVFVFFFNIHDKCIFYHLKICLTKFCWFCQLKVIVYSKLFQYLHYKKVYFWRKCKNKVFRQKKLQQATKIQKGPQTKIPECFNITTINPIRFIKMSWSITGLHLGGHTYSPAFHL